MTQVGPIRLHFKNFIQVMEKAGLFTEGSAPGNTSCWSWDRLSAHMRREPSLEWSKCGRLAGKRKLDPGDIIGAAESSSD